MTKSGASSRAEGVSGLTRAFVCIPAGMLCCLVFSHLCEAQSDSVNRTAVIKAPDSTTSSYSERLDQLERARRQAELRNELLEKRRLSGRLSDMGAFQPKDGGATMLTNRLYKYRKRNDYQEIKFKFEPIVVPNRYRKPPTSYSTSQIHDLVALYSRQYGLDESLVHAMIQVESAGNPNAVSSKGASGLMQLMPTTAKDMGVKNIFDPAENIAGGTQYMAKLLNLFKGNVSLALAGYNAGPETVKQYDGIPPFRETQDYVLSVLRKWNINVHNGNRIAYPDSEPRSAAKIIAKKDFPPASIPKASTPSQGAGQKAVRFKSGNVQIADKVIDAGDYYYLEAGGRCFRIHKDKIDSVSGVVERQLAAKM